MGKKSLSKETHEQDLINVPEVEEAEQERVSYDDLIDELEEAKQLLDKSEKQVLLLHADMQNVRKRAESDVSKAHKYALEKFAQALLAPLDSLEQGLQATIPEDQAAARGMQEGMSLTLKMFYDTFKQFNIELIDPKIGDAFDHAQHEAMTLQPSAEFEPNSIVHVVQKGYKLNDRLLRAARVVVAKAVENSEDAPK